MNAELIKALRYCADEDKVCTELTNCGYYGKGFFCQDVLLHDAADALEAAERLLDQNTKRCEGLRQQLREANESYEKHINELEAQIPKEGEWIMCESEKPYIVSKCSVCGGMTSEHGHYCPNCGAKMRGAE